MHRRPQVVTAQPGWFSHEDECVEASPWSMGQHQPPFQLESPTLCTADPNCSKCVPDLHGRSPFSRFDVHMRPDSAQTSMANKAQGGVSVRRDKDAPSDESCGELRNRCRVLNNARYNPRQ
jgi:hypothetical protein